MSHYMTALAMKQVGLKPATKIVLYWLSDHHNSETGECFPSHKRLAELCEMTDRSVRNHLEELQNLGLIKIVERKRDNGSQTSNSYLLQLMDTYGDNHPRKNIPTPLENISDHPRKNIPTLNLGNNNHVIEPYRAKSKRATSLPDQWVPNQKNIADAISRDFTEEEITHEAEQFRNYHLSKGSTFKSWDAAWRTWLGNARKFSKAYNARTGGNAQTMLSAFGKLANRLQG